MKISRPRHDNGTCTLNPSIRGRQSSELRASLVYRIEQVPRQYTEKRVGVAGHLAAKSMLGLAKFSCYLSHLKF